MSKSDYNGLLDAREPYIDCILLQQKAIEHGKVIKRYVTPGISLLGFPMTQNVVTVRIVIRIYCKFRCWKDRDDNCYRVPCYRYCPKDHGVEITVDMRSSNRNVATKTCYEIQEEVRAAKIDGGAKIVRNHK